MEILKLLLTPADVLERTPSSKTLFLTKFRTFLKENLADSPVNLSLRTKGTHTHMLYSNMFLVA